MNTLTLALDWIPNINHIGFFIASEKGFYTDANLDVTITDPSIDNYGITPAKKVELGQADLALCPTESVISYRTKSNPFDMIAIAAVLKEDLSAIAVESNKGIKSPRDLDNKLYSSYKAKYEDRIVKEMIKNDGGQGDLKIVYPNKFGIWNTVLEGTADATWIFLNWEGVEVEQANAELKYFQMKDYGIPYSYSPVIVAGESSVKRRPKVFKDFLRATKKGFLFSKEHKKEAQNIMARLIPKKDQHIDLSKALELSQHAFGNEDNWGLIELEKMQLFLDWLYTKGLEQKRISITEIADNSYL